MKKIVAQLVFVLFISINSIIASEPTVWSVNSRADVLRGDAHGVSIDQNGTITLAPKLTEAFKTDQSYIWSSVIDAAGNVYLGTGGDGKIFKVDRNGKGMLFADLAEMNVSSLAIGRSGEIFAGTSPDGKVYLIDGNGKVTVYFEPNEKYIWSLVMLSDGSLAVGTGSSGKIFRVRSANTSPANSLLFDTSETHVISLATDKLGNLYAGTDSNGLVMKFGSDGRPFGLLDSPLREIHDIAVGADGSIYVLALGESASAPAGTDAVTPAPTPAKKAAPVTKPNPLTPEPPAKSRYDLTGAKSAVYRIMPDGGSEIIWSSPTVTGFSVVADRTGSGVLLGTSDKGRIYDIGNDGSETLLLQTDAGQISTMRSSSGEIIATSSNPGSLYRFGQGTVATGTYESSVLNANGTAAWGRIWWRSSGDIKIQTRSGNTEDPDETWSDWSSALSAQSGAPVASPKAQYLQWRALFAASDRPASLNEVNVAFIAKNVAPEVLSIQVLPTNVGLAANPPVQIDPNIEILGLDPADFGIPVVAVPPRRVYQRGATSLQWTAEDRNGDKLIYDVFYKPVTDTNFRLLRGGLTDNFLTIDGQSLADGRFVFRVVVSDLPSNPKGFALSGEKTTQPIDIDNTPPTVTGGSPQNVGKNIRVVFDAVDAASYLTRAEYSINGGDWRPVYADDGISDSPTERYSIELPADAVGESVVTIRVYDVNGNSGNARAVVSR